MQSEQKEGEISLRIDKDGRNVYSSSEKICANFAKKAPAFFHRDSPERENKNRMTGFSGD